MTPEEKKLIEHQQQEVKKNLHAWIDNLEFVVSVDFGEMDATDEHMVELHIKGREKTKS